MSSVKSIISNNYLEMMRFEHSGKAFRPLPEVFITGALNPGSIGEEIAKKFQNVYFFSGDVRLGMSHELCKECDTLIMCHGVSHLDWFEDCPIEKMKEIIDVNFYGSLNMAQIFVQATIDKPYRKRIISIGSMAYKAVLNGSVAYCASKAALAQAMRCMAWELAPKGYDVFCIHPSNTLDTPMSEETIEGLMRYRELSREQAEAYWNDSMLRDESLTKDEIARLIASIVYNQFAYLSGSNIELSGGQR